MEITKDTKNSMLFLQYLIANGFNPNNYNEILELGQSVPNSLSQFLTIFRQYLLSRKVIYSELDKYEMNGAFGYMQQGEIYVPKTPENDQHFLYEAPKVPYNRYYYSYPCINEFDVIICEGLDVSLSQTTKLRQDKYYGLCLDAINEKDSYAEDARRKKLIALGTLLNSMNSSDRNSYELALDEDKKLGKEFYLIKKQK